MIALILWFSLRAGAATLESAYLEKLAEARNPSTVSELRKNFASIRLHQLTCDSQMEQGLTPWSCYVVMNRLTEWKAISAREAAERTEELNRACRRAARAALHSSEASLEGPDRELSPECRELVAKTRAAVRYRQGRPSDN